MVQHPFRYLVFLNLFLISGLRKGANILIWRHASGQTARAAASAILLIPILFLASCSADTPPAPTVTIGFIEGTPTPTIEVFARGRPLMAAALVEPSGRMTVAGTIERDVIYSNGNYGYGPSVGVGVGGGSWGGNSWRGAGVGVGVPIGGPSYAPSQPTDVRQRARIVVPDMADYRANWERIIVRVTFGTDPANSEIADIPAPAPGGR